MADDLFNAMLDDVGSGALDLSASKPVESDPIFSGIADQFADQEKQRNALVARAGMQAVPEQYADHLQLSKQFGVPVDFVGRNAPKLQEWKGVQDLTQLMDRNPPLSKWYASEDNTAAIKVDELRQLDTLSWLYRSASEAFGEGRSDVDLASLRYKQLMGQASGEEIARADTMSADREPRSFGADSWLGKGWVGAAQQLPIMGQTLLGGLETGIKTAVGFGVGAAIVGQLGPQAAAPEEWITVPGAALAGFRVGSIAGQWEAGFKLESGLAYDEFRSIRDENGVPIDDDVARAAAIVSGAAGSLLETYGFRKLASTVPGLDKVSGMLGRDAIKQAMTRPTVREALKTFAKNVFETGVTEVTTEVAQEALTIFAGEVAKGYAGTEGADFAMMSSEDIATRLGDTFAQTLQTMTVMGPALSGTRLGQDVYRSRQAATDLMTIDALIQHAQGNELNARLPEKAKEAVRALTENGPVQHVYIAPEAFSTYFQTAEEASEFAARIGLTDEYNEAQRVGRDMEVPIESFYVDIAGTEIGEAIKQHVRFSPDHMTSQEAEDFNVAWDEALQSLRADYEAGLADDKTAMEGEELIFDDVKNKAMNAGIVPDQAAQYAKLYSTFFRTMAARSGRDAGELYSAYGFDVKRALPTDTEMRAVDNLDLALEVIRRGRIDPLRTRVAKAAGPTLLEAVIARGGIMDSGGELAAMGLPAKAVRAAPSGGADMLAADQTLDFNMYSADDVVRQMAEEGYFPDLADGPTPDDLFNALREELSGRPRTSAQYDNSGDPAIQQAQGLVQFADMLDQLGVDVSTMDNDAIRAAIDEAGFGFVENKGRNKDFSVSENMLRDPVRTLNQEGTQPATGAATTKRGSIQIAPGRTIINMFDQANLSTFLHESGHFFLEVFRDLAAAQPAGPDVGPQNSIIEDWRKMQAYLGVGDDGVISTEAHEKWARSFEAYLFEGKAPSQDVADLFARFRSWLVFVYQSIKKLNAPLNDNIRGVMDRLVATDEEIMAARMSPEFQPAFADAKSAGMSDAQFEDYRRTAQRAVDRAKREMDARMMQEIARETTKEWRDAKKAIREEVRRNYENVPVYKVIKYLQTGEGGPEGERLHLSRDAILSMMGEGALLKLPKSVPPIYRVKGVHPDVVAEMFGFKSGHELLTAMMTVAPIGKAVVEETNLRMRQRYGDLMGDAVARARVAAEAIANDDTGELLNAEIAVLVKKGLATSSVAKEDARRVARQMVRGKTIREAVRVRLYQNANMKAAAEAERAIAKKDWTGALAAKKRQLLNHYMAMEAHQADKDAQAAVAYLNKFAGRKRPKGIWPEHIDRIEALLERFDLRKSVTLKAEQRRSSLAAWITEQEEAGEIVVIPETIRDDAFRKPYRSMTVDDLLTLRDAVKNIEHIGRRRAAVEGDIEGRKHRAKIDEMEAAVAASQELRKAQAGRNPEKIDTVLAGFRSVDSALIKIEQLMSFLDGGDINGPFQRMIFRRIADAQAAETDLNKKVSAQFLKVVSALDQSRMEERITIPGVSRPLRRSEIMVVALNMGNASNLDKMLRGETWDRNPSIVERIVSHLNETEAKAVGEIWELLDQFWPEIAALQKRMSGVEPPRVEASPVEIAGVKLKGGYYPLIYDPDQIVQMARRGQEVDGQLQRNAATQEYRAMAQADRLQFEPGYLRPETSHGFAKERVQAFTAPIKLSLEGSAQHVVKVIHDLTHREALLDAYKLLTDPGVKLAISARYGAEYYAQFIPWLNSIAGDRSPMDGLDMPNRMLRGVRSRATVMAMGLRYSTMITQAAGYLPALNKVNVKSLAGAMTDFFGAGAAASFAVGFGIGTVLGGPAMGMGLGSAAVGAYGWAADRSGHPSAMAKMSEEVYRLSGEMRGRKANLERDIRDQLRRIEGKDSWIAGAQKFSFAGIGYMDQAVTIPVWMAAYKDHVAKFPQDRDGAIAHADSVIRLTQGAGGQKDLAGIMRGHEGLKLVTMFYSYFSAYYAQQREWGRDMKRKIASGEGDYSSLLARQFVLTVAPAVIADMIVGKGPDDDEGYAEWAAKKILMYTFGAVPLARDGINGAFNVFGYSFSPAEKTIDEAVVAPIKIITRYFDDTSGNNPSARELVVQALQTTGYVSGLPLGQPSTTVNNIWRAMEKDDFQFRDIMITRPQ